MAGLSDLFGRNGYIEQLLLWSVVNQVVGALAAPGLLTLQQDVSARHPVQVLDPVTLADLTARGLIIAGEAEAEALKSGIDPARFARLLKLHKVRLQPADLAEAVLRSYMTRSAAEAEAAPQGYDPAMFAVLADLAGDAIGPQDAARALLRKLIPEHGSGAASISYDQAIAESRLHNKWGPVLAKLAHVLLSPPDAASAVVRNFLAHPAAAELAARQGVDAATFATMVHLSGDAPGPQQLAEVLRRGAIPLDGLGPDAVSFTQGIAEGRLADKWAPVIRELAKVWPTPTDALEAELKGQIPAAEAQALYTRLGGDQEFHDWLLATIGNSPTPLEAAILAARGIIAEHGVGPDVLSYDQAVRESRYRDKWGPAYRRLSEHIPPPSTIVTMLAHRALDDGQARQLLAENDMTSDLAAAYVAEADYEAVSDYRGLTQGAVTDMYYNHLIDRPQALAILEVLHVSAQAAGLLLDYADLHYLIDSINRSVQRIATLYTGRKIGTDTAKNALAQLQIPAGTVDEIIGTWDLQAAANVKTLTAAEIADAWYYSIWDDATAIAELEAIGYTPYDAWAYLSIKNKAPLPNPPPRIVAAPPGAVIPGVT